MGMSIPNSVAFPADDGRPMKTSKDSLPSQYERNRHFATPGTAGPELEAIFEKKSSEIRRNFSERRATLVALTEELVKAEKEKDLYGIARILGTMESVAHRAKMDAQRLQAIENKKRQARELIARM